MATWEQRAESQHTTAKQSWAPGPWQHEPDRIEWRHVGMPCLIVRSESTGALCGYVGVPPGHPFHGIDLRAIDGVEEPHGGITYTGTCSEHGKICHVAKLGEPEAVWWIGFDCAHSGDFCPAYSLEYASGGSYKKVGFVRHEVEAFATRLADVAQA